MFEFKKPPNIFDRYDIKLILYGILITAVSAYLMYKYAILPLTYRMNVMVRISATTGYCLLAMTLGISLAKKDNQVYSHDDLGDLLKSGKNEEPDSKKQYENYLLFKSLFQEIQQPGMTKDRALYTYNQMIEVVHNLPPSKKRECTKICNEIKKELKNA